MSKAAKINKDGTVITVHNYRPVTDDNGIQHPRNIFQLWTDAELNDIGYAKFDEENVPSDKRSTGTTDSFVDGRVYRSHTTRDFVPPDDPEPTIIIKEAWTEVTKEAWTEEVPAVMEDDVEVTPATTIDHPEETVDHPAETEPNPNYDYVSLRQRDYANTPEELIIALWEQVVEERSEVAEEIEVKRQEVKERFPKPAEESAEESD
jgi:hypothetical protein